jgi:hypothetical protein
MNRAERRATSKQKPAPAPVNWNEKAKEYGRQQSMHDCGQLLKDVFTVLRDKFSWSDTQLAELTKELNSLR